MPDWLKEIAATMYKGMGVAHPRLLLIFCLLIFGTVGALLGWGLYATGRLQYEAETLAPKSTPSAGQKDAPPTAQRIGNCSAVVVGNNSRADASCEGEKQ